jgi:hypothetical protein
MRPDFSRLRTRVVAAGSVYVLVMAALASFAAAPIYGVPVGSPYLRVVVVGVATAFVLAGIARVWRWPAWATVAAAAAVFAVLSVTLAVTLDPTAAGLVEALRQTALGLSTGWKDLLTVDLPVGSYRNLLVPVLAVLFVGTLSSLLLAWRADARSTWAAAPAIAMSGFGLLFGSTVASDPVRIGSLLVPAPRELAVGALVLVTSVAWLSWRTREQRREALVRAAGASGVRVARRASGAQVRRTALAAAMVVVAVVAGAALTPLVAEGRTRDVLRSATGPQEALRNAVSPLTTYRTQFDDAHFQAPLFSVQRVSGPLPDRIRIATLTTYDGTEYRADGDDRLFTRVPDGRDADPGVSSTVRIEVSGLRGLWLPTFGSLQRVAFGGTDAAALADAFYYDGQTDAAVDTAAGGLHSGAVYEVSATVAPQRALAALQPSGVRPDVDLPQSVTDWIDQQHVSHDGAGLQALVQRLRARGYLSHALSVPAGGAAWERPLGEGYVFQPSASGHSLARVDAMFRALVERGDRVAQGGGAAQASAGAGPAWGQASLVAAVGDDEQFAVATALVAQALGFPARVVVGVRLTGSDLPACGAGVCTGGDVSAWTEVRDRDGSWVAVDVTPQYENGLDPSTVQERDPENPTEVRPQTAHEVVPPDPVQQDAVNAEGRPADAVDLEPLWAGLRIAGGTVIVLALLAGPFLAVVAAKAMRRRRRRQAVTVRERVIGGWDEYVDTAVDFGMPRPGVRTRTELAEAYASPNAGALARAADRAVFSDDGPGADEAEAFWGIVDAERRALAEGRTVRRRLRAAVSLSSFVRIARRSSDPRGGDAGHRCPTT